MSRNPWFCQFLAGVLARPVPAEWHETFRAARLAVRQFGSRA